MSDTPQNACEVPLAERLRVIPDDHRVVIPCQWASDGPTCHRSIAVGALMHRAADALLAKDAEISRLRGWLAESQANDRTAMQYLAEVRAIVGGDDFPDMVKRVARLRVDGERYRYAKEHLRIGHMRYDNHADCYCEFEDTGDTAIDKEKK